MYVHSFVETDVKTVTYQTTDCGTWPVPFASELLSVFKFVHCKITDEKLLRDVL